MKAERRHELQENVLAHWLAQQIEAIKPYWQTIVAVVVVTIVAVLAVNYFRGRASTQKTVGWDDYLRAVASGDLDELEDLDKNFPTATSSLWGLLMAGDQRMVTGTNRLYADPKGAQSDLDLAIKNYESVLERAEHPMLIRLATLGLARAQEGRYERSEAIDTYQQLVDKFPESTEAKAAERAIARLNKSDTKQWLAWFPKQDLTPKQFPNFDPSDPGAAFPGRGIPGRGIPGTGLPGAGAGTGIPGSGLGTGVPGVTTPAAGGSGSEFGGLTDPLGIGGAAAGEPEESPPPAGDLPMEEGAPSGDGAASSDAPPPTESAPETDGTAPAEEPTPPAADPAPAATTDATPETSEPASESTAPPTEAPEPDGTAPAEEATPPAADPAPAATTDVAPETSEPANESTAPPTEASEPEATAGGDATPAEEPPVNPEPTDPAQPADPAEATSPSPDDPAPPEGTPKPADN